MEEDAAAASWVDDLQAKLEAKRAEDERAMHINNERASVGQHELEEEHIASSAAALRERKRHDQARAAEADRLERERIAAEEAIAEADRLERERIVQKKAEADRRKKERAAAAKAAVEREYSDVACDERIRASVKHLRQRMGQGVLDVGGHKFHAIVTDLPDAHNKSIVRILLGGLEANEDKLDSTQAVVHLGRSCDDALQTLVAKRQILGQIRDDEIEKVRELAPDIDEDEAMGSMLAVLETNDAGSADSDIINAAKDCISQAVNANVIPKKGQTPSNWTRHYTSFTLEYKAALAKTIAIYSLMNVADNVLLASVIDDATLSDAKVLAESKGFDSIDRWSLARFHFYVAAPALASDSEIDMEIAISVLCNGFVGLLSVDSDEAWRKHGDQILLPGDDGNIEASENAPDYFSAEAKGDARKTGVVLNILAILQSQVIFSQCALSDDKIKDGKGLALAILRCPTRDIKAKGSLLMRGDLFFNKEKVAKAQKFVERSLDFFLKKSKGRTDLYRKYCLFLDLRNDIAPQIELLLRVLHRSHLGADMLALLEE